MNISWNSITIPKPITLFDSWAFYYGGNGNLPGVVSVGRKVYYEGTITDWLNITFNVFGNPISFADDGAFYIQGKLITELIIPDGVTEIKNQAFLSCPGITKIVLPNSIQKIGELALVCGPSNIEYKGTKVQWDTMTKAENWNGGRENTIIVCSEGEIAPY